MSIQIVKNIKYNIRKSFFNTLKRKPWFLDTVSAVIVLLFNGVLIWAFDLGDSDLLPPFFLSLFFVFVFLGRKIDMQKVAKDLLREGDVIAFIMGGDRVQFGYVAAFVQKEETERLGLRPEQEYVTVTDKSGEIRILPVSNIGMIK